MKSLSKSVTALAMHRKAMWMTCLVALVSGLAFSAEISHGQSNAELFIAPSGNDSTCARGRGRPCASFGRAYQLARCGDVVQVADGTYSSTVPIRYSEVLSATNCNRSVVFRAAANANPIVGP